MTSKQAPFLTSSDDPRVKAIKGVAPGTSFDVLRLDSTPLRDVPSSSGHGVESRKIYRKAATTRNSIGKEILASHGASSHNGRSSRIRKRPGEVEARAVSKSCSIPNRKVWKSSTEAGDRAISKSCTLPNKRILDRSDIVHPLTRTKLASPGENSSGNRKSYFAEIDAFEFAEEENRSETKKETV